MAVCGVPINIGRTVRGFEVRGGDKKIIKALDFTGLTYKLDIILNRVRRACRLGNEISSFNTVRMTSSMIWRLADGL